MLQPIHTIPIDQRPPHGPFFSKIFFPLFFNLGIFGGSAAQFLCLPLLLIPFGIGRRYFDVAIGWTKDGFARLRKLHHHPKSYRVVILITVLFAPTSLVITTNTPPSITNLVERNPATGEMIKINLPDRLVIMSNHQAYTDWMYLWIIAAYAGTDKGIIILLKASLRGIPVVGWAMVSHSHKAKIGVLMGWGAALVQVYLYEEKLGGG